MWIVRRPKNHQYWIWRFCWVDLFPKGRLKQDRGEVQGEFYARAGQKVGSNCPTHFLDKFLGSRWRNLGLFGSRWLGLAGSREVGLVEGEESVGISYFCLSLCWSSVFNLREGWLNQTGWFFGIVPKGGGVIFNPKICVADFGNIKQGFLSMKLIQKCNFRVQGIFFQQLHWEKSKQDTLWRRP